MLQFGSALEALERIIDAQGRHAARAAPGALIHEVRSNSSGRITRINPREISRIARRAGAPMDKSAGVDLLHLVGDEIVAGEALFMIHASVEADFQATAEIAGSGHIFEIE